MRGILSVRRTLFGSFVIGAAELKQLHERLASLTKAAPVWVISIRDGLTITSEDPEILSSDPILGSSTVLQVSAAARGDDLNVSVDLNCGSSPVTFRVQGADRNLVTACDNELTHLILGARAWWSFLRAPFGRSSNFALIWGTIVGMAGLASLIFMSTLMWQNQKIDPVLSRSHTAFQIVVLVILTTPSMIFRFDRGGKRWSAFSGIMKYVIGVVFAGFLINWVSSVWNPFAP
jgi:hypothetical protein